MSAKIKFEDVDLLGVDCIIWKLNIEVLSPFAYQVDYYESRCPRIALSEDSDFSFTRIVL